MHTSSSRNTSWCLEHATNFDNFAARIKMTMLKGMSQSGVVFRSSLNEYIFTITPSGRYSLTLWEGKTNTGALLTLGTSKLIHQGLGQSNELAVIARGTTIDLYLNQHFLDEVRDSGTRLGLFGFIGTSTPGASGEVAYNQAQFWRF